jgi:LemA protein
MTLAYIAAGLGVALLVWSAFAFNSLVRAHTRANEAWSGVDVQLKRRHDLVPNLVETVRAFVDHEQAVMRAVDDAWETATTSSGRRGRQAAEYELSQAIADLRARAESFPELRASEAFRRLGSQLAEVDGEIQYARRIYNSNVEIFNSRVQGFPGAIVRRLGGFRAMGFFELIPVWHSAAGTAADAPAQGSEAAAA